MSNKTNVVFLDTGSLGPGLDFSHYHSLPLSTEYYENSAEQEVVSRCLEAEIIVVNKVQLRKETLLKLSRLKLICVAATGMNNICLDTCKTLGIDVKNVTNYAGSSIAQLVFSYMAELSTKTQSYNQLVNEGKWQQAEHFCMFDLPINELAGKTIGLIGYGNLAKSVEKIANAFDMTVLIAEHKTGSEIRAGRVSFEQVICDSDFISIHCPLNEQTCDLITATELQKMKATSVLINTARGGIVNEADLVTALEKKWIAGAATDVLTVEPAQDDNPLLAYQGDNLIITPHIAWASIEARQRLFLQVVNNIEQFLAEQS